MLAPRTNDFNIQQTFKRDMTTIQDQHSKLQVAVRENKPKYSVIIHLLFFSSIFFFFKIKKGFSPSLDVKKQHSATTTQQNSVTKEHNSLTTGQNSG